MNTAPVVLSERMVQMNYIDKISHTTVGKILKENSLKPHLVEEWCIPKEQSADFCFKQRYPDE